MRIRQSLSLAIIACSALCGPPAATKDTPAVTFKFAPQAPGSYIEETVTRRAMIVAGEDAGNEEATFKIKSSVSREAEGYRIVAEPQSFQRTRGGKPVKDPVGDILDAAVVTYHLDSSGKLKSIEGYADVLSRMMQVAPKDTKKALPAMMSEKALVERETALWNSRIGDFVGKAAGKNAVWVSECAYPLPDATTAGFYVVTVFDRMVEQDGRRLARLRFFLTADRESIQRRVNDLARDVVKDVPRPRPLTAPAGFAISGEGERLVDPETMLIYSEKGTKEVHVSLRDPGKGSPIPVLIQETRESKIARPAEPAKS